MYKKDKERAKNYEQFSVVEAQRLRQMMLKMRLEGSKQEG